MAFFEPWSEADDAIKQEAIETASEITFSDKSIVQWIDAEWYLKLVPNPGAASEAENFIAEQRGIG